MKDDYWRDAFWRKHDDELREYAVAGVTRAYAADKLGIAPVFVKTRIATLKIKWVRADTKKPKQEKPKSKPKPKPKPKEPEKVNRKPTPTPKHKREQPPSLIEIEERKRVWDFPDSGRCVFPMGDPGTVGFRFCSEDANGSYCDEHRRLCYYQNGPSKKAGASGDVAGD